MNRELEIRERVALYGLELTGHDREALYIARGNLEFYAYSDLRYLLSETARLRADLAEQSRLHRISVNAGADAMRQIKEQLAAMTAERDGLRDVHTTLNGVMCGIRDDRDAWRIRSEAAEADLNHIAQEMFSDNSEDLRGEWYPCEVCRKYDGGKDCFDCLAASYDESKPGTAFEWRGPEEDKP